MTNRDDGPPPAKSARVRPVEKFRQKILPSKSAAGDPRFDPLYGPVNKQSFEKNYTFLREEQAKEEEQRRFRMKCLKCFLRRVELEKSGENLADYDLSDTENEVFGEEHKKDLAILKRSPSNAIYEELHRLQRESQIYVSQTKDGQVHDRQHKIYTNRMKEEVKAVREGKKAKPFFPKRKEVKQLILSDTFDRLEKAGGKAAVGKYLVGKQKRVH